MRGAAVAKPGAGTIRERLQEIPISDILHAVDPISVDMEICYPALLGDHVEIPRRRKRGVTAADRIVSRSLLYEAPQRAAEIHPRLTVIALPRVPFVRIAIGSLVCVNMKSVIRGALIGAAPRKGHHHIRNQPNVQTMAKLGQLSQIAVRSRPAIVIGLPELSIRRVHMRSAVSPLPFVITVCRG